MTEDQFNQNVDAGNVSVIDPSQPAPITQPNTVDISEYESLLASLRKPRIFLDAVPTFVPKTFSDSIQFVDDGSKKLCVYFENAWNVITVSGTGLSKIRAHLG